MNARVILLISILLPCVMLYGVWYFGVEPLIHYHSLWVACGTHDMNACYYLKKY